MVLHELAHAYHHQFLDDGYANPEVRPPTAAAIDEKRYDRSSTTTARRSGRTPPTNPMEYFAEATEAFFGTNDFYPFVRAELRRHDPEMESLLRRSGAWTERPVRRSVAPSIARPDRGDGRLDVVALDGLAGEGLHGEAHRHAVLGGGLDLVADGASAAAIWSGPSEAGTHSWIRARSSG